MIFVTEHCQMIQDVCIGIYWEALVFNFPCYDNLEILRSILKTGNLEKQQRKICYISRKT